MCNDHAAENLCWLEESRSLLEACGSGWVKRSDFKLLSYFARLNQPRKGAKAQRKPVPLPEVSFAPLPGWFSSTAAIRIRFTTGESLATQPLGAQYSAVSKLKRAVSCRNLTGIHVALSLP